MLKSLKFYKDLKDTLKARLSDENDQDENARIKMVIEKLDSENDEFQKEENEEEDDEVIKQSK